MDLMYEMERGANFVRCDVGSFRQVQCVVKWYSFDYVYHLATEFGRWNGVDFYGDTLDD